MKKFWIGLAAGIVLVPLAALAFVLLGGMPVATSAPPLPMERFLANTALHEAMQSGAPKTVPVAMTQDNLLAGAQIYRDHCSECHGLPGQPKPANIAGMYPPVPQLFAHHEEHHGGKRPERRGPPPANLIQRFTAGIYWRTKNGTRLTGMPSFDKTLSDTQMWQVAAFLANRRNLTPQLLQALAPASAPAAQPVAASAKMK